jgi:Tol biopolymer transport system component
MDINGSFQTRLTDNAMYDGEPSFSPLLPNGSGIDIAFTSGRDSNDLDFEIYKMNADGTEQDRLTEDPGTDEAPSWSPDGKKIAFTSDRETADNPYGDDEIYTMDPDGSNPTNVSNTDKWSRDEAPSWSPDGKEIAFQSNRNANDWEIYKMKADGTQQINLTNNASSPDFQPSWSPSGTQIAFETLAWARSTVPTTIPVAITFQGRTLSLTGGVSRFYSSRNTSKEKLGKRVGAGLLWWPCPKNRRKICRKSIIQEHCWYYWRRW